MKLHTSAAAVAAFLVTVVLTGCSKPSDTVGKGTIDRTADEAAIRSLLAANWTASTARNAKEVAATYVPDGDAWIAGLSRWTTRDSSRKAEEDFGGMPGFQSYDGTIETIRFISPDAAIIEITGTTTLDTGRFEEETTIVVARTENGWEIAAWRVMTFDETLLNLLRE